MPVRISGAIELRRAHRLGQKARQVAGIVNPCQTEVDHLAPARAVEHQVGGLHVAVNHAETEWAYANTSAASAATRQARVGSIGPAALTRSLRLPPSSNSMAM